ncbi:VanW family protein [Nocardioides sp.]|uniref:VanW family protein n=1 Tax=Nocardioides sp. TaxID=35761 RepID=UPI0031FE440D|nr:VanW family protein [Nocardioides sp.]
MKDRGETPAREREGGRLVLLVIVGLLLLFGAGWAAAYLGASDKVPRGTTVAGVDIGGHTRSEAVQVLKDGLADRVSAPISVTVDGKTQSVTPEDAGLSVDYVASVAAAGAEQSWDPQHLWDYYTGGVDLEAKVGVNELHMQDLLDSLAAGLGKPARDGQVLFVDGGVQVVDPRVGEELDPKTARAAIEAAYLRDRPTARLTLTQARPDIDDSDVQRALDEFANPAMSGPITLVFGHSPVQLFPRDYASALKMSPENGELVPDLDVDKLTKLLDGAISDNGAPVDATVKLVRGKPRVVPAKPGVSYDPTDVSEAFLKLATRPVGQRHMRVPATVVDADFSTADARKLKIREQVSTFTTYFPYAEYRNTNIGRAGELINGTVLKPGETFSLNDTVGERTAANGFTTGFIISNGIFAEDLGGGVSQMATTTFNAMFFAGLKDVEHKTHSFYIDRYPVGREATVAWGSVDLRFENDTPYGVLIDAHVTPSTPSAQGVVTVSMYSTKYWDVTTSTGDRYNFVGPATRTLSGPDCYPNTGYDGFDINVMRYFKKPGDSNLDHQEKFHTHYIPSDTVICE